MFVLPEPWLMLFYSGRSTDNLREASMRKTIIIIMKMVVMVVVMVIILMIVIIMVITAPIMNKCATIMITYTVVEMAAA